MSISRDEAAETLRNIQQAQTRSFQAYGYKSAAPFFFIWGAVWMVGYTASDLWPVAGGRIWPALLLIAFIASGIFGRRAGRRDGTAESRARNNRIGLRMLATWLAVFAYIAAVMVVMRPTAAAANAFVPLLVGAAYLILGIWMGTRFVIAGIAILALTLGGYFFLPAHFLLWMAAVGGTTLVATGLWLRRA